MIESLPRAAEKLRGLMDKKDAPRAETPLQKVQKAAEELESAAAERAPARAAPGVRRVIVEKPKFDVRDYLWTSTVGLITLLGQLTLVAFLTFFLLISGDTFRRKLVQITGPTLTRKKITVQALDEINAQIHRYLMVQLWSSVGVGVVIGAIFHYMGMPHALAWGVATAVLNLIPYVGSIAVSLAAIVAAFIQFDFDVALTVAGICLVVQTIQGNLLVPWLTSQASRMNPVAVFVSVLAWGWLWGVWGMLLGIPIMMVIKAVCDRVEDLQPVGELLGS
jgi:predicted PurR-regulated permease PerM